MVNVILSEDCGNSPKNQFLEKLTIAFAQGDTEFILSKVMPDIRWQLVGQKQIEGRNALAAALAQRPDNKVVELTIHHVMTHGKAGAVNGTLTLAGGETRAFCDVYEFNGAKASSIRAITSYMITLSGENKVSIPGLEQQACMD